MRVWWSANVLSEGEIALIERSALRILGEIGVQEVKVSADYVGFAVPDRFLVGYGLDHAQRFRHLPYVATLS